jgi:3-oxoadipate enol-lactonase
MARALAGLIGDGPAVVVPGTRHLTALENPEVVVDALLTLLERPAAGDKVGERA